MFKLPKADQHGNYWFGSIVDAPAIFPVKGKDSPQKNKMWFLSLGGRGIVWNGSDFKYYSSPQEALDELNGVGEK